MSFFRFVFSELHQSKRFVFLFLINLSLGLTSFSALEFLKSSINKTVMDQSRQVLGADLGITSRRPFTDDEFAITEKELVQNKQTAIAQTDMLEMFSMVSTAANPKESRASLVQLKAVQSSFPFYGRILTSPKANVIDLQKSHGVWVYPEILTLLGVQLGDLLKIGNQEFKITAVVTDDAASGISTNMAPRIYMSFDQLQKTDLLKPGTLAWHSRLYHLPNLSDADLERSRDVIYKNLPTSDVQVFTHKNSSEQTARLLTYLGDFLGLVSLASLFIACIGLTFLLSTYLQDKAKSIAILRVLGYSQSKALSFYLVQLIVLIFLGALISLGFASALLPLIVQTTQAIASFQIRLNLDFVTLSTCLILGMTGGFCLLLPQMIKLFYAHPLQLLSGSSQTEQKKNFQRKALVGLSFLPTLLLFYALCVRQMNSYHNGSIFFLSFLGAGLVFFVVSYFLLPFVSRLPKIKWTALSWALRDLSRLRTATVTGFLSLALGSFLVNVVPQIEANIQAEIQKPPTSKIPSLFLFDIQEEQVEELKKIMLQEGQTLQNVSPLIRARLTAVNAVPFSRGNGAFKTENATREEENESQFRNRGFNLSFRKTLDTQSETLVSGTPLPQTPVSPGSVAEISLEQRFAQRLNLKLGDVLTFDIQDTPLEGKVTSLRRVNWTSFQPNFFVVFQTGALDDAPKTFLATIPKLSTSDKINLQKTIVKSLPNISMIDVDRLIEKLLKLIEQMGWALNVMSFFCILVGLTVLFALANDQVRSREWDIGLMKSLGASHLTILSCFMWQFSLIVCFASFFGGLLSLAGSYLFSTLLFDGAWFFNAKIPFLTLMLLTTSSPLLIYLSVRQGLKFSARELLSRRN